MAAYSVQHGKDNDSQLFLIGSPLLIISLFCFTYLMIQSHSMQHSQTFNKTLPASTSSHPSGLTTTYTKKATLTPVNSPTPSDNPSVSPQPTSNPNSLQAAGSAPSVKSVTQVKTGSSSNPTPINQTQQHSSNQSDKPSLLKKIVNLL